MKTEMRTQRIVRNLDARTQVGVSMTCTLAEAAAQHSLDLEIMEQDELQLLEVTREWEDRYNQFRCGNDLPKRAWYATDRKRSQIVVEEMFAKAEQC